MPIQIYNSILSWYLKKRYHQIELFKKYPNDVQGDVLRYLVETATNTEFGKLYDFKSIKNYNDFKNRIPLNHYEDLAPMIERIRRGEQNIFWPSDIKWFAKSSGTTNAKSKFIPISTEALDNCHYKAGKDTLAIYVNNNPETEVFSGKMMRLGGSHSIYENNDTYSGDLSAILIDNLPFWAELGTTPSNKVSLMDGWEEKMKAIINETINEDVRSLAGVPSWMLVLLNDIIKQTGKDNLLDIWPNLELYFHGGVGFSPFKELYKNLIPKSDFKYFEIYNASEGFFAIQDNNYSDELLLMLDYGIYYEFIAMDEIDDENPKTINLDGVELYRNYAIVISTNSGLWRYIIGDTVRFTSLSPYRIKISGRTKHFINAFGEEVIIENAEEALKFACTKTGAIFTEYTAGPVYMKEKKSGAHEWIIEFDKAPNSINEFTKHLDDALKGLNSDYEAKRFNDMTLSLPILHKARKGLFYDWLKGRGKLGGQNKIPRLSNNRIYLDVLLDMN
ncbi:MAG: GH3 auxin-responsive promoter family protein [Flavobacteriales bacterium]|nr:GH3 auxin-responsive promoter family protein [Flavobacteriales bacterium]